MKDEALDLALEALEYLMTNKTIHYTYRDKAEEAITAIKQARALDKKADNARELGLDYEPADGTQVSKVWWDGEKLMAKPIPLVDFYQPAPVQEPVGLIDRLTNPEQHYEFTDPKKANAVLMSLCQEAADALAAPVQEPVAWGVIASNTGRICQVELDADEVEGHNPKHIVPLYTTPPAAQPAPTVQEPVAQAWDEGYRAGIDDERTSEANIGIAGFGAKVEPARNNPYRATLPKQPAPVQAVDTDELTILWMLINAWRDAPAPALHICGKINSYVLALKQPTPPAAQPAVQEPVATVIKKGADRQWMSERLASLPDGIYSLYPTAPVQQAPVQPVPLTDEQIESLLPDDDTPMSLGEAFVRFARLVEAHHGITKGQQ
jgi:hypothetical protein